MGFPNSEHIIKHVIDKKIINMVYNEESKGFTLNFDNGESVRFYPHNNSIIATPFNKEGFIKQSILIMESS